MEETSYDLPREERICKFRHSNIVEDELYFLWFVRYMMKYDLFSSDHYNTFIKLLSSDDRPTLIHLGNFLQRSFKLV